MVREAVVVWVGIGEEVGDAEGGEPVCDGDFRRADGDAGEVDLGVGDLAEDGGGGFIGDPGADGGRWVGGAGGPEP